MWGLISVLGVLGPLDPDWRVHVDRVGKRSTER